MSSIDKNELLINGAAYDWASLTIKFMIDGMPREGVIFGATSINYENDMPVINNFGKGRLPVSYGRQNISATASITISAEELHKLEDLVPGAVIQDLFKFDIICSYETAEGNRRKDVIKDCHITKNGRTLAQNDPESLIEMELNPSFVDFNID